jgi:hypothetical protein
VAQSRLQPAGANGTDPRDGEPRGLKMVVGQGMALASLGTGVGLVLALASSRLVESLL